VHHIDTGLIGPLGDLNSLLNGSRGDIEVLDTVRGGQAQEHGLFGREVCANGLDDLEQQTGTVLERATIVISALVGDGGQELVDQVTVGAVDLDSVHASLVGADSTVSKSLDNLGDLFDGQFAGDLVLIIPALTGGRANNILGPVLRSRECFRVVGGLGGSL